MMFSYEALYFLGTLPFPPAMYLLWGSWVTRLEISISPQNNKLKRVIFTFTERCGFLHTKNIFMVYGDLCKCVLLKIERFLKQFQLRTVGKMETPACVCLYLRLGCSCMRLHSWGHVPNWPHDSVACMLQCDITVKKSCGWKKSWRKTQQFDSDKRLNKWAHPHSCSQRDVVERDTSSDDTQADLEVLKKKFKEEKSSKYLLNYQNWDSKKTILPLFSSSFLFGPFSDR